MINNILSLAKRYDMKFALSKVLYIRWIKESDEELYRRLVDAVEKGIIIPVGGMWVKSDTNAVGGESLVRQFLYGQRMLMEVFGKPTEVGWLPNSFGFTGSLPQILVKSGIKIFFTHKLYWNRQNRFLYSLFKWIGVNGSEVIAVNYATYGNDLTPRQIVNAWLDHTQPETPAFITFGYGDGGGGPTWLMMERLKVYSRAPGIPKVVLADPYQYYEAVKNADMPKWTGELYLEAHRGTYSTGHKLKKLIRVAEERLKDLEVVSYIYDLKKSYRDLWLELLEAEFHDIASATLVKEAYDYYVDKMERLVARVEDEIAGIVSNNTARASDKVLVVSTLPWLRRGVVKATVKNAVQQVIGGEIYSIVEVSGMGIYCFDRGEEAAASDLEADNEAVSNGIIRVRGESVIEDLENNVVAAKDFYITACTDIPADWDGWGGTSTRGTLGAA